MAIGNARNSECSGETISHEHWLEGKTKVNIGRAGGSKGIVKCVGDGKDVQ